MRIFAALIVPLLLSGCSHAALGPDAFLNWVKTDKRIVCEKAIDHYGFSVKYLPASFLALREVKDKQPNRENFQASVKNYLSSYNLIFKISDKDQSKDILKEDVGTKAAYFGKLQYFMAGIENDISLADGADTIRCILCNFERTYNLNPVLTFNLLFDKKNRQKEHFDHDLTLVYNDRALGVGTVKLTLDKGDLNAIPELNIP